MTKQVTIGNRRSLGVCMMTLYAIGVMPLSFSKACSRSEDPSNPFRIETQLTSLAKATAWMNSEPLTAPALKGKIVLVMFCTYTCINWLRTMPYVRSWSEKYKKSGLVVIGVHTPEFPFEADLDNVRKAIGGMNIAFPVAVDNDRIIWEAFNNAYWPALYFIDTTGKIRHYQFGEGDYDNSERVIQQLLQEAGKKDFDPELIAVNGVGIEAAPDLVSLQSPEEYLGYARAENFASRGGGAGTRRVFKFPSKLKDQQWAISGDWTLTDHSVSSNAARAKITIRFHARDVHLVMGPATRGKEIRFRLFIDGEVVTQGHGIDVDEQGNGVIKAQRLYQLIRQTVPVTDRELVIEFLDPGAEAFSFTFG